jgi:hypothetical protein
MVVAITPKVRRPYNSHPVYKMLERGRRFTKSPPEAVDFFFSKPIAAAFPQSGPKPMLLFLLLMITASYRSTLKLTGAGCLASCAVMGYAIV